MPHISSIVVFYGDQLRIIQNHIGDQLKSNFFVYHANL